MHSILVEYLMIQDKIPALKINCKENLSRKGILQKLVIIYHSFAHTKENTIFIGNELAKLGFMCICVDLDRHGERENVTEKFPYQYFYDCMFNTAIEINIVIDYLVSREMVNKEEITVLGISLGGMAALSAAVIDQRIKNIITIASSANFTELAKRKRKPSLARILSDNQYDIDEIIYHTLNLSKKYDPYHNISKIKNKNILMVNGGLDTEIPVSIVKEFQQILNQESKSATTKRDFIVMSSLGHQIQNIMIKKACDWLVNI